VTWTAVDIPSFTLLLRFRGWGLIYSVDGPSLVRTGLRSLMSDDGATGSTGGSFLESIESCWTERPGLPCCSLVPFVFFFFGDNIRSWVVSGEYSTSI
jgi:hypothetical protein